jgi:hypothetical protein
MASQWRREKRVHVALSAAKGLLRATPQMLFGALRDQVPAAPARCFAALSMTCSPYGSAYMFLRSEARNDTALLLTLGVDAEGAQARRKLGDALFGD